MVPGQLVMKIEDMSCEHCTNAVRGALADIPGVFAVEVTLQPKQAVITYDTSEVQEQTLVAAVEEAGYTPEV